MIKRLGSESGYSMVEVLAAIVILSLAILPMVSMFDAGLRAAVLGGNYDKGRALASKKLEEVKSLDYGQVVARYPPVNGESEGSPDTGSEGAFDYTIRTLYVDSELQPDGDARTRARVEVTVEWDGGDNSYSTSGLVAAGSP